MHQDASGSFGYRALLNRGSQAKHEATPDKSGALECFSFWPTSNKHASSSCSELVKSFSVCMNECVCVCVQRYKRSVELDCAC